MSARRSKNWRDLPVAGQSAAMPFAAATRTPVVRTGLDRLVAGEGPQLRGRKVACLCHPASVDAQLVHVRDRLEQLGADLCALLGPEHGLDAAAQDMEIVGQGDAADSTAVRAAAAVPVHSLYGDTVESLRPTPAMFESAELLIIDLQDVGARYYTYVWTALMSAQVALDAGLEVWILDRPNPLGGLDDTVEGGAVEAGFKSFVGWHDVATRHGLTVGEVVHMALEELGSKYLKQFNVLDCSGWKRSMLFDATGLPWVMPSPNMPTLQTALVYPGQCLWEGTLASEGRGTTRPFELFGAPWVQPKAWLEALDPADFPGLGLRPVHFKPMFQKHAGERCGGLQLHVLDAAAVRSVRSAWALLCAARRVFGDGLTWRTERYEYVDDIPAIDLLAGGSWLRRGVDTGVSVDELAAHEAAPREAFLRRRRPFLRYD